MNRKERWGLSYLGWLMLVLFAAVVSVIITLRIYQFLAVTERVDAKFMVVEGWVPQYAARAGVEEFKRGYVQVFTTGGPITGMGGYTNDYNTAASLGAGRLRAEGLPKEAIQMVPSRISGRDRTYSSAQALRNWLDQQGALIQSVNILTSDTHARRTRLLFQKALGDGIQVGVIAVPNPDYDASHWWRYSEGVKDIITETIAYLYAKLFFYPSKSEIGTEDAVIEP